MVLGRLNELRWYIHCDIPAMDMQRIPLDSLAMLACSKLVEIDLKLIWLDYGQREVGVLGFWHIGAFHKMTK